VRFAEAVRDLDDRQPESMPEPSLDRIRALADLLDHPELTYPSIQVTGTNGKTTTARLVTSLACAHGLTTGTFVSPHIDAVNERISVCGRPIQDEEFAEEYEHLRPYLERVDGLGSPRVTYFEALTALAYLWFADKPVSLGVFEVGMGGTWDATNLVRGDVAVLCPIGLDHVRQLGSTVREVAEEKSGIVKEGRTAVVREQRPEAMAVIEKRCADVGATLLLEGEAFSLSARTSGVGGQTVGIRGIHAIYDDDVFLPLFGEQAARNAAASIVACESLLGRALDDRALKSALRSATSPGRIEVVQRHPVVVLDGAHNPDAATALVAALREAFTWRRLHLVVGMFADKDVEAVTAILAPLADRAYVCMTSSPRAAARDRVAGGLVNGGAREVRTVDTVPSAVDAAREAAEGHDLILVTGSFYTVAEARPLFVGA
jgi:dihydrofolate synthase / folylpolyglutamate synthase